MIVPSCGIVSEALFFPLLLMGPPIISLGDQLTPTFSPDGRQVAFTWNGDAQDNFDIYLKLVNSSSPPLRLTTNKDIDYSPAWSPDGEWIAFCRGTDTLGGAVWIVPALGGAERKIVELDTLASPANRFLAWSRDSSKPVVSARIAGVSGGLHLVDINNGVRRTITAPSPSEEDMHPAVSNDGKMVAFHPRCRARSQPDHDRPDRGRKASTDNLSAARLQRSSNLDSRRHTYCTFPMQAVSPMSGCRAFAPPAARRNLPRLAIVFRR